MLVVLSVFVRLCTIILPDSALWERLYCQQWMPLVRGDVLILTGSVWQVCVIVACSLRLILLSGFLVDIMFACRTKMSKKKKRRRRGDGWGSATLWLGTRSGLSLQPTGVIGLWASLKYFYLRFFFFFFSGETKVPVLTHKHLSRQLQLFCCFFFSL